MMVQIPMFTRTALADTSYAVGAHGQTVATALLEASGYEVSNHGDYCRGHDLTAVDPETGFVIRVEVKAARRNSRGGWQFTLRKRGPYGYAEHTHSDVLLLLAVMASGRIVPYVIPVDDVRDKRAIHIPSHPSIYRGKYAHYRQSANNIWLEV